jgi:hypothetical protein
MLAPTARDEDAYLCEPSSMSLPATNASDMPATVEPDRGAGLIYPDSWIPSVPRPGYRR